MKNLAGHAASLFLFRFDIHRGGINFVMNEAIAEDLYSETELKLRPLVHACSETLLRYKALCIGSTIMDGYILVDGDFEVMLSTGLGRCFLRDEKRHLFSDAHEIAKLLMEVMDRRTLEIDSGEYPGPQNVISSISRTGMLTQELEDIGNKQKDTDLIHLPFLTPDELPEDVSTRVSYDHRGHCMTFHHETYGLIGKVVLVDGLMPHLVADLSKERSEYLEVKRRLLERIISTIELELMSRVW